MGMGNVHPDAVAVLLYGIGMVRVDYPLGKAKGPSRYVVLSLRSPNMTPMGLGMVPTAIREDIWREIAQKAPSRLSLSSEDVMDLFQRRDTEALLLLAHELLYEAFESAAPEHLDEIEKPAGYRIPGWDTKLRG